MVALPRWAVFAGSLGALLAAGCAAKPANAPVAAAENPAARIAELEERLRELEHRCGTQALRPDERRTLEELVVTNRRLLSELSRQGARRPEVLRPEVPREEPIAVQGSVASFPTEEQLLEDPASTRERLERVLEEFREEPLDSSSGLSRERREALRVLLRRERTLDTNPWR